MDGGKGEGELREGVVSGREGGAGEKVVSAKLFQR